MTAVHRSSFSLDSMRRISSNLKIDHQRSDSLGQLRRKQLTNMNMLNLRLWMPLVWGIIIEGAQPAVSGFSTLRLTRTVCSILKKILFCCLMLNTVETTLRTTRSRQSSRTLTRILQSIIRAYVDCHALLNELWRSSPSRQGERTWLWASQWVSDRQSTILSHPLPVGGHIRVPYIIPSDL